MKEKSIYKVKSKWFGLSLFISILTPIAIPCIPIGFVMGGPIGFTLGGVCSGIVFFAFYAIPLFWVHYGSVKRRVNTFQAIEEKYIYKVGEIAVQLGNQNENDIRNDIYYLIEKGYLKGYLFDGNEITLNENQKLQKKQVVNICPYCGSKKIKLDENGDYYCSYCDAKFNLNK